MADCQQEDLKLPRLVLATDLLLLPPTPPLLLMLLRILAQTIIMFQLLLPPLPLPPNNKTATTVTTATTATAAATTTTPTITTNTAPATSLTTSTTLSVSCYDCFYLSLATIRSTPWCTCCSGTALAAGSAGALAFGGANKVETVFSSDLRSLACALHRKVLQTLVGCFVESWTNWDSRCFCRDPPNTANGAIWPGFIL